MLICVNAPREKTSGYCNLPNRIHAVQECDARDDDSSNADGIPLYYFLKIMSSDSLKEETKTLAAVKFIV